MYIHIHIHTQVLGNAKGAVAVVVSIMVFRNAVSFTGMVGYAVCVAGCFMYSEVCVHVWVGWDHHLVCETVYVDCVLVGHPCIGSPRSQIAQ